MHGSLPADSPPQLWSQVVEQTPGYGVTASSGGMTTPSTTAAGMSGVGRSLMLRGMAERNARVQMAQCPGGLAQWAQTQPMSALHMPQMAPPLHQPLPGRPAMPYQQAVQPPKRSTGSGVASNPSADKTAPAGGASSQDRGRPTTRGWGDGGQCISCPRGTQGKVSMQLLCQEGDLLSGSMPSVPPPAASEGTQPRHGGRPRSALCDHA